MSKQQDSSRLYGLLFEQVTNHFPDESLGNRSELVVDLYQAVHVWATGTEDDVYGVSDSVVTLDVVFGDTECRKSNTELF